MGTTTTITVAGMSCGHCVSSVQSELSRIDGVTDVAVDLESGVVDITSDGPVDRAAIEAAVDDAGDEVAP